MGSLEEYLATHPELKLSLEKATVEDIARAMRGIVTLLNVMAAHAAKQEMIVYYRLKEGRHDDGPSNPRVQISIVQEVS